MKQKIKIFSAFPLKEAIKNCLAEGYFPADLEQIEQMKKDGLIDKNIWYDTSTIMYKDEIRTAKDIQ